MKGFTLIEVIVTVAIVLVVTGFVIVNYNSYNDVQTLKQAGLTLKNNLRFAQSKALSGEKPNPCTELSGYTVTFASTNYSIQAKCTPEGPSGSIIAINLPSGVTVSPVPSSFVFNVLSRGTSLTSGLCITLTGSGQQYEMSVNTNGDINDLGLNYSGSCP